MIWKSGSQVVNTYMESLISPFSYGQIMYAKSLPLN